MACSIEAIKPEDALGLANTMMSAFNLDPHWKTLWKGKPLNEIINDCANRIPWNLVTGGTLKRYQKAVDRVSGEVVGYARWVLPGDMEASWPAACGPEVDEEVKKTFEIMYRSVTDEGRIRGVDHQMIVDLSAPIDESEEAAKKVHGGRFLYLDYLAVHPNHQRKGIGSKLLESGLAFAEENNLKVMVNARTQGMQLYLQHGFVKVDEVVQEGLQYGWTEPQITAVMIKELQA